MTNLADFDNGQSRVDQWIEEERNGVKFPVPFDEALKLSATIRSNEELNLEYLDLLDEIVGNGVRQLGIGEVE